MDEEEASFVPSVGEGDTLSGGGIGGGADGRTGRVVAMLAGLDPPREEEEEKEEEDLSLSFAAALGFSSFSSLSLLLLSQGTGTRREDLKGFLASSFGGG